MNTTQSSVARIMSTGFVVSLIFGIVLFWANAVLRKIGKEELVGGKGQRLSLDLNLGDKFISDPNLVVSPPYVYCPTPFMESDIYLDIFWENFIWIPGYPEQPYFWQFDLDLKSTEVPAKWDAKQGLIVVERGDSKDEAETPQICYVGPKGFSNTPDRVLERFSEPKLCYHEDPATLFVYDIDLKTFFRIDFAQEKVTSKSWADKSIIATGRKYLSKFQGFLQLHVRGATRLETDLEMKTRLEKEQQDGPMASYMYEESMPFDPRMAFTRESPEATRERIPIGPSVERVLPTSGPWAMDEQGTIYLIDRDTLSLDSPLGHLPDCGKEKTHDPSRLLAYTVLPLFVDQQYFGLVAASLSRDGSELVMVLLDQQGRETDRSADYLKPQHYRYGRMTSHVRTVLDFAQPLVFSVASSLWGPRTEAMAGYRNLFVLPLSMPGRIAGDETLKLGDRYGTLVMWNVFTWCVGLLLAIAVTRDLKQHGMSGKTQKAWLFACMGFGWIAVTTYLLTRPRTHFVTCTGCGLTRCTDQALCLHCEADWEMHELQAPGWRVVD